MRSLLFVYVCFAAVLKETLACSCAGRITIDESLRREETAVFATVSEVLNPGVDQFRSLYYRATAHRVIKGCGLTQNREFYIKTGANSALCGVELSTSTRYLLFGSVTNEAIDGFIRSPQPVLSIGLCSAHTQMRNLDRSTMLNLQHRARPVCWNTRTCYRNRDCWRSHGYRSYCNAGVCTARTSPPPPPPRPAPTPPPRPTTLSCENCPDGYYDGCNSCSCFNGRRGACTQRYCTRYGRPSCRNRRPDPPTINVNCQTCPYGYYDGCNTCSCRPDGGPGFCTLRYCYRRGLPRCNRASDRDTPIEINPPVVAPPVVITLPTTAVNCNTCPNGFFDGCNSCRCGSNGEAACTRRGCPGGNIREPSCS